MDAHLVDATRIRPHLRLTLKYPMVRVGVGQIVTKGASRLQPPAALDQQRRCNKRSDSDS